MDDDLTSREQAAPGLQDLRHVRSARDAVLGHIVAPGAVTFSLVELANDLGRASGDFDVLARLEFNLRARLTRDLEVIRRVRSGRSSDPEEAPC